MTQRKKAWYIIFSSLFFIIIMMVWSKHSGPKPACDPNVKVKTVIVIDRSEPVASQTLDAIFERAWTYIELNVPTRGLVSVFQVTKESKKNLQPLFEECKPPNEGSELVENVNRIKLVYENYKKKLRDELSKPVIDLKDAVESPIAQVIIDLSLDDKHFRSSEETKLIVFSDFFEYTPQFTLYACTNAQQAIEKFRQSKSGSMERPTFRNVTVDMHIIPRANVSKSSLQCRTIFWNWFFGDLTCSKDICLNSDYLPG